MSEPEWPDAVHLLRLLAQSTGPGASVRDAGILVAVASRSHATILGTPVHRTALEQAAALLHGILVWRPLQVWNAGLAWAAALGLLVRNGLDLAISPWEQMVITDEITSGALDEVVDITVRLAPFVSIR